MFEFLNMFEELEFCDAIAEYVSSVARNITSGYLGDGLYVIDEQQVTFIVALVSTLMWVFLSVVACWLFSKIILSIVEGVLNW